MRSAEVMKYLADNYLWGILVVSLVCIAIYLIISISLIVKARRVGVDVCASAMIPLFNLGILFKIKKVKLQKETSQLEDRDYEDDEELFKMV